MTIDRYRGPRRIRLNGHCIERLSMLFGDDLNTAVNVKEWE